MSFGHIGSQLITLASILRIPVSMHNLDDERIFRPSAWDRVRIERSRECRLSGVQDLRADVRIVLNRDKQERPPRTRVFEDSKYNETWRSALLPQRFVFQYPAG